MLMCMYFLRDAVKRMENLSESIANDLEKESSSLNFTMTRGNAIQAYIDMKAHIEEAVWLLEDLPTEIAALHGMIRVLERPFLQAQTLEDLNNSLQAFAQPMKSFDRYGNLSYWDCKGSSRMTANSEDIDIGHLSKVAKAMNRLTRPLKVLDPYCRDGNNMRDFQSVYPGLMEDCVMLEISIGLDGISEIEKKEPKRVRRKGTSLLELPKDYTVIDLETTGLDPRLDDIIEVACIKYRDGKESGRFQSLVQPPLSEYGGEGKPCYVNAFIRALTGITNEMLEDAPTFEKIEPQVADFLNGELLVGHNVNFDINFLYDNLEPYGVVLGNDFVDTMRLSRRALPELPHHRLDDLAGYFDVYGEHHRAMGDCEMTHDILAGLAKIIEENHVDLSCHSHGKYQLDLRALQPDPTKFIKDHIFYDRNCVFTGKLERFTRKEAAQIVVNIGGHCENGVTKHTNFLIVGNFDYCANVKGNKSGKRKKAEGLILKGQDLQILSESTFYDLVEGLGDN